MRDRNFKLNPIHAEVIMSFSEFAEFSKSSATFRKNYIMPAIWVPATHWSLLTYHGHQVGTRRSTSGSRGALGALGALGARPPLAPSFGA